MIFSDQSLAGDWIGMSLERLRQVSGAAGLRATVDSVRPDRRATTVTIVRWRASDRAESYGAYSKAPTSQPAPWGRAMPR